jgi:hypothetical protein
MWDSAAGTTSNPCHWSTAKPSGRTSNSSPLPPNDDQHAALVLALEPIGVAATRIPLCVVEDPRAAGHFSVRGDRVHELAASQQRWKCEPASSDIETSGANSGADSAPRTPSAPRRCSTLAGGLGINRTPPNQPCL